MQSIMVRHHLPAQDGFHTPITAVHRTGVNHDEEFASKKLPKLRFIVGDLLSWHLGLAVRMEGLGLFRDSNRQAIFRHDGTLRISGMVDGSGRYRRSGLRLPGLQTFEADAPWRPGCFDDTLLQDILGNQTDFLECLTK